MVKLKMQLAESPDTIDLPVAPGYVVSPYRMQAAVRESSKLTSTIKVTIRSQAETGRYMAYSIIIAGKIQVTDRYFDIAPDVQCPTCAK